MTLLELMASAPLPARQPVAGQVLEVTACFRWPKCCLVIQGRENSVPFGLNKGFRPSCHLQPGQGLLHDAGVSECSVATSIFKF